MGAAGLARGLIKGKWGCKGTVPGRSGSGHLPLLSVKWEQWGSVLSQSRQDPIEKSY